MSKMNFAIIFCVFVNCALLIVSLNSFIPLSSNVEIKLFIIEFNHETKKDAREIEHTIKRNFLKIKNC